MKVMLVNPPYAAWTKGKDYLRVIAGLLPPLGILSLAAYARERVKSIKPVVCDAPAAGMSVADTVKRAIAEAPDVLCLSVVAASFLTAREIARRVRVALSHVPIIVGGPHITASAEDALNSTPEFDCAAVREGEQTFVELLEALQSDGDLAGVKGIVYRRGDGRVVRTPPRELIEDLDGLPDPAWDLLDGFPKRYGVTPFFSPGGPAAGLVTSRGCPFRCAFCFQGTFGHHYRALGADRVIEMVRELQKRYKIRHIVFCDDIFTLDRDRLFSICQKLRKLKPRPVWSCDAHVSTVDREILREMRRSGCWSISYGLESGSPDVLASLNKAMDLERAPQVVLETRQEGILAKGLFMMGGPEESIKSVEETRAFIQSLNLSTLNLSKFTPYPGTALHNELRDRQTLDWEKCNGMNFVVPSRHMSVEELEREYKETIRCFYSSLSISLGHISRAFGRWSNLKRILGVLPGLLDAWLALARDGG